MSEYLNFKEISESVSFEEVLKYFDIPYTETEGELKGKGFIANKEKNVYFNPTGKDKGSVINFVASQKNTDLRTAAALIKGITKKEKEEARRPIPTLELEYHPYLEQFAPADLCKGLNVGYCKQKSIMNGRICFKVGEHYVGYSVEKGDWLFPKGFKRNTLWNIENCDGEKISVVCDLFVATTPLQLWARQ
jgi:hypothetical protein